MDTDLHRTLHESHAHPSLLTDSMTHSKLNSFRPPRCTFPSRFQLWEEIHLYYKWNPFFPVPFASVAIHFSKHDLIITCQDHGLVLDPEMQSLSLSAASGTESGGNSSSSADIKPIYPQNNNNNFEWMPKITYSVLWSRCGNDTSSHLRSTTIIWDALNSV